MLSLTACAGSAPVPEPAATPEPLEPPRTTPLPSAGTPLRGRTTFEYSGGTGDYLIVSEATISAIDGAAPGRSLTMTEQARISLSAEPATDFLLVNGTVQSLAQDPASSFPPAVPSSFVDSVWAQAAAPREPGPDQLCGRSQPVPRHLTSFLPTVGRELQQGQRWDLSYTYSICQGPIPLRVERTDSYLVQGAAAAAGPSGIAIARSSTMRMAGRGVDGQHNVRIEGSGSAQAVFQLDARAGWLVGGTEDSTSDIAITASGHTNRFSQRATRRINRL